MKRVRTLLRVSSRQQLHDDDIPLQRAEAERYIRTKPDWVFDREYIEKAVSAYKNTVKERKILQRIMQDAKNKEFEVLLTYMSDRIGRKEEYSAYVATLNSLGIEVWTIKDGQLKTEEHIDKLLNFIRFWQNEGESKKTSMRVRDAQKEMVQEGKFVGGKAPFGYRLVLSGEISNHGRALHKLEIVPENAAVVRKIYFLAVHQGMGAERIAKKLNEEEIPPIAADRWKGGTVAGILKNPVYMGYPAVGRKAGENGKRLRREEWTYAKKQIEELVIVPKEEWEQAQRLREARRRRLGAGKNLSGKLKEKQEESVPFSTSGKLPLIGISYCGYCKRRLKNASYHNRWYSKKEETEKVSFVGRYQCPEKCEGRYCYSQKYLEGIVFEVVDNYLEGLKPVDLSEKINLMQGRERGMAKKELESLKKQLRLTEQDIVAMNEKIPEAIRGDYLFSAEKLAGLIENREKRKKELEGLILEKERIMGEKMADGKKRYDCESLTMDWKKEFKEADTETKQMLLAALIERIEVKDGEVLIRFWIRKEEFFHCVNIFP